ncbi:MULTISPECIES: helix-turn-helix domain-containing protein [unclassified Halomonas]|uniref:Helix-turn-helix domain-containing protein n=1 Tax=Halomonas sp. H10-59 TaxID=2950874 RepID=A0AAU7KVU0_9GAMM|nr:MULTISPECIES: helix-turn-helix domain-containing protein [unclassified Halomonas]MBY5940109.1 helix-turn-helix domain-containing protein [Halomonas sp. DP5N14-9]MBY6109670.1 helix-turn-helix domain-containing protein [Halomonas sp. DP1Y21-3]MCJ8284445.1 helix-turn-helix domain-containing protein [Halomonas sp.]NQY69499.1 helix-turn-helix domain-containing protein [Halomonas sp.]
MTAAFTTRQIDSRERFAFWHDVVCSHCIPADSQCLDERPFHGSLNVRQYGDVAISTMAASSHRWRRQSHHLSRDSDDDLWLGFLENATARLDQDQRRIAIGPGDLVLYDACRPFEWCLSASALHLVRLPRAPLMRRLTSTEPLTARPIPATLPGATSLKALIRDGARLDAEASSIGLGEAMVDLAALVLEGLGGAGDSRNDALYRRLCHYLRQQHQDPSLSLDRIARDNHVSRRTLTRLFAQHGHTPMAVLWAIRLEQSRATLRAGGIRSVTEVALEHGFTSVSHFSRSFRQAYGHPPSTLLQAGRHAPETM